MLQLFTYSWFKQGWIDAWDCAIKHLNSLNLIVVIVFQCYWLGLLVVSHWSRGFLRSRHGIQCGRGGRSCLQSKAKNIPGAREQFWGGQPCVNISDTEFSFTFSDPHCSFSVSQSSKCSTADSSNVVFVRAQLQPNPDVQQFQLPGWVWSPWASMVLWIVYCRK